MICFEPLSPASSTLIGCSPSEGEGTGSNAKGSCQDKAAAPGGARRAAKGPSVLNCEKQLQTAYVFTIIAYVFLRVRTLD